MQLIRIAVVILLVSASIDTSCTSDSSCENLNVCRNNKCVHKELIPLAWIEYIGSAIMLLVSCIANAGGIGGSSIVISLMLLLFNFDAHGAVANTQVFIFAGTFAATALKFKERHPTKDRPLIYYDILMCIMGPIILGVSVGVIINPMFPEWLILGLVTLLVALLLWDIYGRAKAMYLKEKNEFNASINTNLLENERSIRKKITADVATFLYEILSQNTIESHLHSNLSIKPIETKTDSKSHTESKSHTGSKSHFSSNFALRNDEIKSKVSNGKFNSLVDPTQTININYEFHSKVQSIYQEEKKIISWIPLTYFILLIIISIIFSTIRNSPFIIQIQSCTSGDFGLIVGYILALTFMILFASNYLIRKDLICEKGGYTFDEGDIRWNYRKCIVMSLLGVGTGLIVGLLGIGSGVIIGPLLLSLGVRPEISTISASFSIFISSGIAAVQFFIAGEIDIYYGIWFFGVSIIGSIIGILVLRKIALKRKRVSILVICIGVILLFSLLIIPAVGIMNSVKQSDTGDFQLGFSSIC